ncbi:MAG: DUF559 domain-containing protein [Candidatus Omnitrophica bacterium]|nr:DUF559 domain-containing protein [Candidatus Omnitrophota bacterium]
MKKLLTPNAKRLRNNPTEAEKYLWYMFRNKNLGVKFRRQTVIGKFIVDFVCFENKLIVEIDGGQHAQSEYDSARDQWLREQGFKILRFWNHDVLGKRDGVLQKIVEHLKSTPSLALPTRGREPVKLFD